MRKWKVLGILLLVMSLLVACNGESTVEKMYVHLEEAVSIEEDFAEQQEPLVELEQQEKELYDQIINLNFDEFDRVKELSDQALSKVEQRVEIIQIEKESIDAAKEEFDKVEPMIEDIKEKETQEVSEEMFATMEERYEAYTKLHNVYAESIELDRQLYEMLPQEDIKEEDIKSHIEKVNESYELVIEANEDFNAKTKQYNELKQQLYKTAELDVEYAGAESSK